MRVFFAKHIFVNHNLMDIVIAKARVSRAFLFANRIFPAIKRVFPVFWQNMLTTFITQYAIIYLLAKHYKGDKKRFETLH